MYKIGEFSILSKLSIKTLRYYEKVGILKPVFIDKQNGYRFYDTKQLTEISKIISLRQIGMSIYDIKEFLKEHNEEILLKRKQEIESNILESKDQLQRINYLLEGKNMTYEAIVKDLPGYDIYYMEGVIEDYSKLTEFILKSAEECIKINPNIKCVTPDYCYINYLDGEYKENNIKIRYAQAVEEKGIENDLIKFETLEPITAVCVYHKGDYSKLGEAYSYIMKWIEDNGYKTLGYPRERYIDGIWNKENVEDWLTEIQVPIEKAN